MVLNLYTNHSGKFQKAYSDSVGPECIQSMYISINLCTVKIPVWAEEPTDQALYVYDITKDSFHLHI